MNIPRVTLYKKEMSFNYNKTSALLIKGRKFNKLCFPTMYFRDAYSFTDNCS